LALKVLNRWSCFADHCHLSKIICPKNSASRCPYCP
jgi:hypothetical protein